MFLSKAREIADILAPAYQSASGKSSINQLSCF
jgi:hypothetical protein